MTKPLLILMLVGLFFFKSKSQIDTSFWFVAPDISAQMGDFPIVMHFQTYDQPTIVQVRQPGLGTPAAINLTFSMPASSLYTLDLTPYIGVVENGPANTIDSNGIYISSKENVSVYYSIGTQTTTNKEMITLKGQRALGTEFYTPIPKSSFVMTNTVSDGGVGFDIVATQPGTTTILITPRASSVGRFKNVTFSKILTYGQTFSLKDNNAVNPSELAGSIISADKLISVTIKGSLGSNSTCASYFAEQITPANRLGKDYVVLKGNSNIDVAYIMAPLNGSSFTVSSASGTSYWLINATESFSINILDPITYIKSDKPVYLFHLSGYGCRLSGTQLAPVYCAGNYTSAFTRLTADSLNVNICTRAGFENNFTLTSNGNPIPLAGVNFTPVPGSGGNLVAASIYFSTAFIPVGSYNEVHNTADIFGLSFRNGSTIGGSSYAQATDFEITSFAFANSAPTATICGNTQFTLNGFVGGGPITGVWSLIQGYGTLSGGPNQLTNNVYTPSLLDTTNNISSISPGNRYVKIILSSTGICPNATDTFKLHVKQPPIVVAGASSVVCANNPTIQFSGNVYGAANQGVWSVLIPGNGAFSGINTFTPTYQLSPTDTVQSQLFFVLTSTNNAGCNPVNDTVMIYISKPPIVKASAVNPIIRCSNNSTVSLNGTVSGTTTSTGIWQTSGSGVFLPNNVALSTNYVPSINDIGFGNVWLKLESTNNGLCLPKTDSVNVQFTTPSFANAGPDVNSCVNDPRAALLGSVGGTVTNTGVWSGGGGTFSPSNSVLTATYNGTPAEVTQGFVTLTLTTSNNGICLGTTDLVKVNFQSKPFANFSVTSVCLNQYTEFTDKSINLSPVSFINGWTWSYGDNSLPTSTVNPKHTYANVGTYTAQLVVKNSFNCTDTLRKPVVVYELPTADFLFSRACSGSAQQINFTDNSSIALPSTILPSGHYWDFGGSGIAYVEDTSIVFQSEGLYSVSHIVTSNKGCQSIVTKSINITPRPIARFIHFNNSSQALGAYVSFRDTSAYATTWSWDFGNGETSNAKYPNSYYTENGTYLVSLTVTDQFGCPSTFTAGVTVSTIVSDIIKLIPNVITPNDDGKNDFWRLDFIEVFFPEAEIEIYNRWGVKLFRSVGYSNAWDGSYKGDPLPVGAYFFTINLHDKDATPVIKGTVTLIK